MHLIKAYFAAIILFFSLTPTYAQKHLFFFHTPENEINAFRHFDAEADGYNPINTFLLAKMSELMYLERIDYQMRYLQNGQQPLTVLPSSDFIKKYPAVKDDNFKAVYQKRFEHYFYDPSGRPQKHQNPNTLLTDPEISFDHCYWQDSILWAKENMPEFHFIHKTEYWDEKKKHGIDPELIVVSKKDYILIIFRGTDKVEDNEWSEWTGTDFKIGQVRAGGNMMKARVHKGFWQSFDLIRDDLIRTLDRCNAQNKKIWLSGHSLGGSMSILTGVYLKTLGFNVQNIYAFAAPRVVGDIKFVKMADRLLPGKIHRFEYYLDPIALLWAPRYKHVGQRNWFDAAHHENYKLHIDTKERYISFWPWEFRRHSHKDKRGKTEMRLKREKMSGLMTELPFRFYYHNPQWYVKAAYEQLTEQQKEVLPDVDDSFPFLYDSAKGPMPGTK
jgi:triacylglycerol lipase